MPIFDLDSLLLPVSDDAPAGDNLEYAGVAELERLATGSPGKVDPVSQEVVGAEEPEWRKVREAAQALFSQTKDLRVGFILTRAGLALHGLPGLSEGLVLLSRMCTEFWDTVYPVLDKDEDNDPIERLNVLANLSDPEGLMRSLRQTPVVESREVGRYTLRDLDYAAGRLTPPEGKVAPTPSLLAAAWMSGDAQLHADRKAAVETAYLAVLEIDKTFRDQTGMTPSTDLLRQTLKRIKEFYEQQSPAGEAGDAGDTDTAQTGVDSPPVPGGTVRTGGALASRGDALKLLQQVAEFVRKTEPSSPAPMFIDRAIKVLQMDFASIVMSLMPDAKDRIEMLGGISLDPPSDE